MSKQETKRSNRKTHSDQSSWKLRHNVFSRYVVTLISVLYNTKIKWVISLTKKIFPSNLRDMGKKKLETQSIVEAVSSSMWPWHLVYWPLEESLKTNEGWGYNGSRLLIKNSF